VSESLFPPSFNSLFDTATTPSLVPRKDPNLEHQIEGYGTAHEQSEAPPAFSAASHFEQSSSRSTAEAELKAALPRDTKERAGPKDHFDDGEPPPPYTEGPSPLDSFTYVMASAGGAASIITQVSQGGGGGGGAISALGGISMSNLNMGDAELANHSTERGWI